MAVNKISGIVSNWPYAQTSISPISAGNSKLTTNTPKKIVYPYLQSTITPISTGVKQKPIPPLPGVAISGGSYGFPT